MGSHNTQINPFVAGIFLLFISLLVAIEEFERLLNAGSRPENLVKAVDSKFRKSAQEVHIKYSKVRGFRGAL